MSEYDRDLVVELLRQLHDAAETILQRIGPIRNVHDLTDSRAGREKLDSICMQLIAIGEGLKNLDRLAAPCFRATRRCIGNGPKACGT